jgi:replicative DNA helicase
MQWPDRVLAELGGLGLRAWHFYRPAHQQLFGLLLEMERAGEAIDLVTVPNKIARSGRAGDYGGIEYVVELPDHVPSSASVGHYARGVIDDERRRTLIDAVDTVRARALDGREDPNQVADVAIGKLLAGHDGGSHAGWVSVADTLQVVVEDAREAILNPEARKSGQSTGFRDLDVKLGGLYPGDLIILAGRPAMGKSALAVQIAEHAAESGPVGVFSLEMPKIDLARRLVCKRAKINVQRLRRNDLTETEFGRLARSVDGLARSLWVDDQAALTVGEVAARARRLERAQGPLALLVIDYLQIMGEELGGHSSREREVAHMSKSAKKLAKDLACPVVLLSQLNRAVEGRKDKRPIMSDLRESGAVEQDADVIVFCFRPEYYWPDEPRYRRHAELIVAKQRNGPTGSVDLVFEGEFTHFRDQTGAEMAREGRTI